MPRLLTAALAMLALTIAALALGRWPLYVAELWTWQATSGAWSTLLTEVVRDTHPPLHPILVWLLRQVSGAEWLSRLPSAAGALGSAGLLWWALRQRLGAGWAGLGALSLVLSPAWVCYAGIARPYALLMACGGALLAGAFRLPEAPRQGAALLAVAGTCGLYLHYVAAAPIGAALLAAAAAALAQPSAARRTQLLAVCAAGASIAGAFLPWYLLVGRYHVGKSAWESPSLDVLRYLAFEVQDFTSFAALGIVVLAAIGAAAGAWRRQWALVGLAVGAIVVPYLLSANQQVLLRLYGFVGMLPILVLLAVYGARAVLARPAPWLIIAAVAQAPEAWMVLRLPSAPLGNQQSDAGLHDSAQDMALLVGLLPAGTRLVVPRTVEPNVLAHYAPGAHIGEPQPGDWAMLERPRRPRDAPGCILNNAFARPLRLPDDESCGRVLAALDDPRRADWRLERALQEPAPADQLAILGGARRDGWATPELTQAHLLADTDPDAAEQLIRAGLREALRWGERPTAQHLLALQEKLRLAAGDTSSAEATRAQQRCIEGAMPNAWLLSRCRSPLTAWTVPKRPDAPASGRR